MTSRKNHNDSDYNSEELEIYDLDGNFLHLQNRDDFYKTIREEFEKTGKITRQVRVVRFLLMTWEGRIYIQKRSYTKSENPGLYDKTVGGHVKAHYSEDMAAVLECQEELAIPMMVLSNSDFVAVRDTIDLSIVGIMKKLDRINGNISIRRSADGSFIEQPLIATYYIGFYNGSIRFKDGESTGVETFSLSELESLMKKEPERFTDDLKFMIEEFKQYLVPLSEYPSTTENSLAL